jgi:hypothetical protein
MRRHTNYIVYGILFIASAIMISCLTVLCYPLLSITELLYTHPFGTWGIPGILLIIGLIFFEAERERKKSDE